MRYIFPYVFALVYWLLFFVSITVPSFAYYAIGLLLLWSLVTIVVIDRKEWYRHWNVWLNFLLFFASSFFFSLIIVSPPLRQLYVMVGGALGGFLTYMLLRYMSTPNPFIAKSYLLVISFTYLITFWQISALVYFMLVSYDAQLVPAAFLLALAAFLLGRGSIFDHGLKKSSAVLVLSVLVLTTTEFSMILSLLPVHYYTLATLLTVWFFFVVEMVILGQETSSRKGLFKRYIALTLLAMMALLLTTAWQ